MTQLFVADDGKPRCSWVRQADEFIHYHDHEWGFPVHDDVRLFEKISLEAFQSGLSWRTIYNKRDHFRTAFDNFEFTKVAQYSADDVQRLLDNQGIVRHRGKIEAVINNAGCALELVAQEGSLASFFWSFATPEDHLETPQSRSVSPSSKALAKALKKRGWKFVGPTTAFAFMQAMGLINDHAEGCYVRSIVENIRITKDA